MRSSAISEDGAAASFAGLYETYLNVNGIDDVLANVQRCYLSLWSERAVQYRMRRGGGADEAMAVVVMGLVPSETSGIAFTAHPVTGARDCIVINASWGLGEAIVSGRVTPDMFVITKGSYALTEREIYAKELAIYPHPEGGGTIEETLTAERAEGPVAQRRRGPRGRAHGRAGRDALRQPAGPRVGHPRRPALPAAVEADYDAVVLRAKHEMLRHCMGHLFQSAEVD